MHVKDEGLLHARSCPNRSPSLHSVHARANLVAKYSNPGIFHPPNLPIFRALLIPTSPTSGALEKTFMPRSKVEQYTAVHIPAKDSCIR